MARMKLTTAERLRNAIRADRFNWKNYVNGGLWHGASIQTQALHVSYGQIGFLVFIRDEEGYNEVEYDWEMGTITLRKQ